MMATWYNEINQSLNGNYKSDCLMATELVIRPMALDIRTNSWIPEF